MSKSSSLCCTRRSRRSQKGRIKGRRTRSSTLTAPTPEDWEGFQSGHIPVVFDKVYYTPDNPSDVEAEIRRGSTVRLLGEKNFMKRKLQNLGYPYRSISRSIFGKNYEVLDTYENGSIVGIPTNQDGSIRFFPADVVQLVQVGTTAPLQLRGDGTKDRQRDEMPPWVNISRPEVDERTARLVNENPPINIDSNTINGAGSRSMVISSNSKDFNLTLKSASVRYPLRWMSIEEQNRFVKAIDTMMLNGEYSKLASAHGWPGTCIWRRHRTTAFPLWNRMHVLKFEHALQRADRENGGNGAISLPYWDFGIPLGPNRKYVPEIIRTELSAFAEQYLQEHSEGVTLCNPSALQLPLDEELLEALLHNRSAVTTEIAEMLEAPLFQEFATSSSSRRLNIEHLHNRVHAALGSLSMVMELAAHHPIFWLVHCNLDRILEGYLQAHPETSREIEGLGMTDLIPFSRPKFSNTSSRYASCIDAISDLTRPQFDRIPKPLTDKCTERIGRAVLMFPNVDVRTLRRSYQLKLYAVPKQEGLELDFASKPEKLKQYFATTAGVIYSKIPPSNNKKLVIPRPKGWFNVYCRTGGALEDLRVTNSRYKLVIIAKDSSGGVCNLNDILKQGILPRPFIGGPMFLNRAVLVPGQRHYDVTIIQKYLRKLGYLNAAPTGVFDQATKCALVAFQEFVRIRVDGVLGPITRAQMTRVRYSGIPDSKPARAIFRRNETIHYFIETFPPYIQASKFQIEVQRCFSQWARALKFNFVQIHDWKNANIKIGFKNHSLFCTEPFEFSARGSFLCNIDEQQASIDLDSSERWLLHSDPVRTGCFKIQPVLLHGIGHLLGMSNSSSDISVMNPFYSNRQPFLMEDDYQVAARLYS